MFNALLEFGAEFGSEFGYWWFYKSETEKSHSEGHWPEAIITELSGSNIHDGSVVVLRSRRLKHMEMRKHDCQRWVSKSRGARQGRTRLTCLPLRLKCIPAFQNKAFAPRAANFLGNVRLG